MDGGAWWVAVHGVATNRTRLSNFTFTFHFHVLEKKMATHSSVLAWRIPGTMEPHGLPSMGSHRVGHDWSNLAAAALNIYHYLKSQSYCLLIHQILPCKIFQHYRILQYSHWGCLQKMDVFLVCIYTIEPRTPPPFWRGRKYHQAG